jgi:arylsulfatase A-like enzyme
VAPHGDYPFDGISLLNVLQDPQSTVERELFWRMKYRDQKAMRAGNWKYLSLEGNEFLFDLAKDARERANLGRREAARLEAMRTRYRDWEAGVPTIPPDAAVSLVYDRKTMALP